ncbi:MAG: hypothetical protein C0591_13360 [Marinilabiliales bacterium]|nr:MAG: hypothetical protein C0591_13360 [Marinilabiliales bacterium]
MMKKQLIAIMSIVLLFGCGNPETKVSNQNVLNELEQLAETQDYFKLKKNYEAKNNQLSEAHSLYFSAIISKVFNKPEISNSAINHSLANENFNLNDTLLNKLYRAKLQNHINLYEYGEAASTSTYIQNHFQSLIDSADLEMLQNEIKIWRALSDIPKQQIIKNSDCTFPMYRDKVGLFNVDVSFGDSTKNFLFDTGANFSAIKRSLVEQLGLTLIEADFYVTAATGAQVKSDIAVVDELKMGDIICKNVVCLVLNDEDISFPQIDYYPNGIIGFPVIEAMDEIRISKDNQIFVPQNPVEYSFNNFALDGLMPILACEYEGDTLSFHFDTGATKTSIYPRFYNDYQSEIEKNYEKKSFKAGSAGGEYHFDGYEITDLHLKVADSEAILEKVNLHTENIGGEESNFHGNFGQDYIKQFDEMIISFKYSSLLFK